MTGHATHRDRLSKFILSGAFNTFVTYLLYLALLQVLPYRWSYTISYIIGIALAYALYRYLVFRSSGGRWGLLWVMVIYLFQYLLGLGLVSLWVQVLDAPALWAPVFTIAVSLPLSYMLNRRVFVRHGKQLAAARSQDYL